MGHRRFCTARKDFATGMQEIFFSFRATSPSANDRSPAELMFRCHMRTNFEPARRSTSDNHVNVTPTPERIHAAPEPQQPPPRFCGPYKVNDSVRVRLPHAPKGCSPFSAPRRITEVLGNYT